MNPTPANPPAGDSLLRIVGALLEHRKLFARVCGGLFVLVVAVGLMRPRHFTAAGSFVSAAPTGSMSRLAGLAAQFGVALPGSIEAGRTPDFYVDLLRSPQILRALVEAEYRVAVDGETITGTLIDFYRIRQPTPERSRERAVKRLRENLLVSSAIKTGVVSFKVRARYPDLALQIAQRILSQVNEFNFKTRQSQANAERRFVEERSRLADRELREAEDRLQHFLQENREFRSSPQLTFAHDRLQRDVDTRQQVRTTLMQAYEQARIEEVRDTPVISVLEEPVAPPRPDGRLLLFKGLLAIAIGMVGGGFWIIAREMVRRDGGLDPSAARLVDALWAQTRRELRRPWTLFRGPGPPPSAPVSG